MSHTNKTPKTAADLKELLADDHCVKVAGIDIDGVLRGKVLDKSKFLSTLEDGFGFCSVVFGWDMHDLCYNHPTAIAESGYADFVAKPDISTMRRIPWEENKTPLFLLDFYDPASNGQKRLSVCPRGLLKTVVEKFEERGIEAMCGLEYEFFNFAETPSSLAEKQGHDIKQLTPGMFGYSMLRPALNQQFFDGIYSNCRAIGAHIEGLHTETGPGVYEAALKYTNALEMADRAQLFKLTAKQVGLKNGVIASFMAKPNEKLPGCSGHIHFSLRDIQSKANLFVPASATAGGRTRLDSAIGSSDGGNGGMMAKLNDTDAAAAAAAAATAAAEHSSVMSPSMQSFVAGILQGLPSIQPLLAPNVNSYKRLVEGYWAPVNVNWGIEQRTAAVRIIVPPVCSPEATRVEVRVPGSDINPHLAIAAILGCGLRGIELGLELPAAVGTAAYNADTVPKLAKNLLDATECMLESGSIARQVLGDAFVDHYGATRKHEWGLWSRAVTNWEISRYLEIS
ncbi:glutamine synthetase/guanido kinase [Ramicandelaber brevisporus]|nr:glutamine synthetase/guanido kinase [Ramicandelaber brevisporus]